MKRLLLGFMVVCLVTCWGSQAIAQEYEPVVKPNYRQAAQYSTRYLSQFMYDTSVRPQWIGESDEFWYSYRDSKGTHYHRVDPQREIKEPLFDAVKLASLLSEELKKPQDANRLRLSRAEVNDEGTELTFTVENTKYVYDLAKETLTKSEKPDEEEAERSISSFNSREEYIEYMRERRRREQEEQQDNGGQTNQRSRKPDPNAHRSFSPDRKSYVFSKGHDLYYVAIPEDYEPPKDEEEKDKDEASEEEGKESESDDATKSDDSDKGKEDDQQQDTEDDVKDDGDSDDDDTDEDKQDVEDENDVEEQDKDDDGDAAQEEQEEQKQQEEQKDVDQDGDKQDDQDEKGKEEDQKEDDGEEKDGDDEDKDQKDDVKEEKSDESAEEEDDEEKEIPIPKIGLELDETAVRLSEDGAADYSFAGRPTGSRSRSFRLEDIKEDQKTRPSVSWSKDSKHFYISRRDARGVKELWVINSLADPRPTLESYAYPMPGEEHIRTSELYYVNVDAKKLNRIEPKWTDEGYTNTHWTDDSKQLRFIRRDRLLRNIEFCTLDLETGKAKCLIEEGFENTNISPQSVRYLDETGEMIWWSERSGWGHYYLFDKDGKLKNAITSGEFRASRIIDVDEKNRMLYFRGSGREPGENIYQTHLYSVRLDGSGLKLMDPGDASHSSTLSPSKQFVVDNCSRVDMAPVSILRDVHGNEIMKLEQADLTRLEELGWQLPETFVVKAADGVTNLYGNMWKPFDFDPKKRYPIIAHVYPGPQTEGTRHTFTATAGEQQLAQIGFIVIQVGHRGGTPGRSKAYAAHGYYNLRDYGLADKKAAIEQLAQRFPYIDSERVGIYGHSGGGFMTAAALLREPYNDFFKVGVSTAGNHDNNIYNNSWSERYHGLKVVQAEAERSQARRGSRGSRGQQNRETQRTNDGAFHVEASDYFYEYEMLNHYDVNDLDHWDESAWWDDPELLYQEEQIQDEEQKQEEVTKEKTDDGEDSDEKGDEKKDGEDKDEKQDEDKSDEKDEKKSEKEQTRFEIEVPTNAELAENLKGHLFLIHGELDNNVHPANTLRLVDALIKADKRFDMLYLPATRHGFGQYQPYVTQRMYEYFAEHLLNDYQSSADIGEKQ